MRHAFEPYDLVCLPHPYPAEHIRFGLLQPAEIETLAASVPAAAGERYCAGDFIRQGRTFALSFRMVNRPPLIARLVGLCTHISGMALWQPLLLHRAPRPTNRFYLLLRKA